MTIKRVAVLAAMNSFARTIISGQLWKRLLGMAPILDRKLDLGVMAFAILGVILPVRFASATYVGNATYATRLLTDLGPTDINHERGGAYYVGYGVILYDAFPEHTTQEFVIGTDFSVWTQWWDIDGNLGHPYWSSLGGKIIHHDSSYYTTSVFRYDSCSSDPYIIDIWVGGLDSQWWYNRRSHNGRWSGWVKSEYSPACPSATVSALSASLDPEDGTFDPEGGTLFPEDAALDQPVSFLASTVPEPSSIWIMLTALVGLISYHWRSRPVSKPIKLI